jgi:hypothetical protein
MMSESFHILAEGKVDEGTSRWLQLSLAVATPEWWRRPPMRPDQRKERRATSKLLQEIALLSTVFASFLLLQRLRTE